MYGVTNSVNSSGGISPDAAVLHVKAPIGSTVSISKNNIATKTIGPSRAHTNDSGENADYYFPIKPSNYGEWVITATSGVDTASKSVLISANYEYEVEIDYALYLYKNGKIYPPLGAWSGKDSYSVVATTYDTGHLVTIIKDSGPCSKGNFENGISGAALLAGGNTLYFSVLLTDHTGSSSYSTQAKFGLFNRDLPGKSWNYGYAESLAVAVYGMPDGAAADVYTEFAIDISNLSSSTVYYVGLIAVNVAGTIDKIYIR